MTKSHIDAMDHMLNDIFKKFSGNLSSIKRLKICFCKECDGDGYIEREVHRPMSLIVTLELLTSIELIAQSV